MVINQQHVKQCRVKNDVAVVAYEGVVGLTVQICGIHVVALARLIHDFLHHGVDKVELKVHERLARLELLAQHIERNVGVYPRQHLSEALVGKQPVEGCGHLLRLKRPDVIKLFGDIHRLIQIGSLPRR